MHLIATQVDDSREQLRGKLAAQGERPGYAIDPYFYRSHLVHELELEHLIFKSWIYALHSSCLLYTSPSPRDKRQSRMPSSA